MYQPDAVWMGVARVCDTIVWEVTCASLIRVFEGSRGTHAQLNVVARSLERRVQLRPATCQTAQCTHLWATYTHPREKFLDISFVFNPHAHCPWTPWPRSQTHQCTRQNNTWIFGTLSVSPFLRNVQRTHATINWLHALHTASWIENKGFFGLCRGSCGNEALTVALAQCTVVNTCCENSMSGNIRVGPRSSRSGTARSNRISQGFIGVQKLIQSVLKGDGVVVEGIWRGFEGRFWQVLKGFRRVWYGFEKGSEKLPKSVFENVLERIERFWKGYEQFFFGFEMVWQIWNGFEWVDKCFTDTLQLCRGLLAESRKRQTKERKTELRYSELWLPKSAPWNGWHEHVHSSLPSACAKKKSTCKSKKRCVAETSTILDLLLREEKICAPAGFLFQTVHKLAFEVFVIPFRVMHRWRHRFSTTWQWWRSSFLLLLPLYVTSLHFTSLHFTSLHFTSLHFTSLHFTSLHFTSLHFTSLHFTSLHFTSLHFTSLHFTSLHVTWLDFSWLDLTWLDLTWLDLTWLDLTWLDLTWRDVTRRDLTWLDLTWLDLTWLDLTWLDLTWLDVTGLELT